jgi:hypothetical protein
MKDGMGFSPDSIIFIDERLVFLILNFYSTVIIQSLPLPTKFAVEPLIVYKLRNFSNILQDTINGYA